MTGPSERANALSFGVFELASPRALLVDLAAWTAWATLGLAIAGLLGGLERAPELSASAALGLGLAGTRPRRMLAAPLLGAFSALAGIAADRFGFSALFWAGGATGILASWLRAGEERATLDLLNGALAGAAGATLGLLLAEAVDPSWNLLPREQAVATAALLALASSAALIPSALTWKDRVKLPSERLVELTLSEPYRPPVRRALELEARLRSNATHDTREGIREVAGWVYRLACTLMALDRDLAAVEEGPLLERIEKLLAEAEAATDTFTRERKIATAHHLEQLLSGAATLRTERARAEAMQDYALAWLEEARMGLALARTLPGDAPPNRLPEVLDRLRGHAREGEARREAAREVQRVA